MKKLNSALVLSLMIFLLVGCSKENTQHLNSNDDVTLKKGNANHYVPFNASFEVYVDLESILLGSNVPSPPPFDPPDGLIFKKYQFVYGEGNASHLGLTNLSIEQWWVPTPPPSPPPPGTFHPWSGAGVGEIIFTAANGDILLADYDDAISVHETPTYVTLIYTGRFKDGGTGRFANAEGEFIWEGEFNPVTNFGTVTATGAIKYSK